MISQQEWCAMTILGEVYACCVPSWHCAVRVIETKRIHDVGPARVLQGWYRGWSSEAARRFIFDEEKRRRRRARRGLPPEFFDVAGSFLLRGSV